MPLNPDFASELRKRFTGDIRSDLPSRVLYSTDASIYQIEPLGVVIPRSQEDLQAIVETAARFRIPLVPRGAGTSLAGQAIGEGVIVDFSRWLDRIVEVDPEQRIARVEPGVILAHLNHAAAQHGLQFGPDPASAERATMGGVVGNNATGAHSIIHGMTADHLLAANVLLADGSRATLGVASADAPGEANNPFGAEAPSARDRLGALTGTARSIRALHAEEIEKRFPRTWRNSAGYRLNYLLPWSASRPPGWADAQYPAAPGPGIFNLASLLAGSEGTLAVIEQLTVRLVPKPRHTILGITRFASEAAACDAVPALLELAPSAIELVPRLILEAARRIPSYSRQMDWASGDPAALLLVEFAADDAGHAERAIARLPAGAWVARTAGEQASVWATRKAGLGLLDSAPTPTRPVAFIEDCAIPIEFLGEFVRELQRLMDQYGARGGIYGHASAGCLHARPVLDLHTPSGLHALRDIAEQTLQLALRFGGSMSSEHGDGIARGEWLRAAYGETLAQAMLQLKHAADPDGILNPGKMLQAPPMDTHLRYGPEYRSIPWNPGMDLGRRGGLATAIEQCNGQGVCRKDTGVMCPSFQATREEANSTRGRANLLRAMISVGSTGPASIQIEEATHSALDLCLGCKGCKVECPSGVDMAQLKSAFLEHYHQTRRRPLRDYLFGHLGTTAKFLAAAQPLVGAVLRVPGFERLAAGMLKIAKERPLPRFRRHHTRAYAGAAPPSLLLLRDPFSHYVDHAVEDAATALFHATGEHPFTLRTISAGAALLSKGFLSGARRHARQLLDELEAVDRNASLPLVVLEPSELSAIRSEYRDLLPDRDEAVYRRLSRALSAEEFLVSRGRLEGRPKILPGSRVLFHPHCHEKSDAGAIDPASAAPYAGMQLLQACGYEVALADAGCCGMGGQFGYEAEHYELSQQIGALRLFPLIASSGGANVVATGGACRLHISQATGKTALHPLVLAAQSLGLN